MPAEADNCEVVIPDSRARGTVPLLKSDALRTAKSARLDPVKFNVDQATLTIRELSVLRNASQPKLIAPVCGSTSS
jgi:hypothetical protein